MSLKNQFQSIAHRLHYEAVRPTRKRHLRELCSQNQAPLMVSFYHRVADTNPNGWSISKREFERHVDFCRNNLEPVGLDEVQRRVESSHSPRPTITFTFDDGYRENCEFAIPLLIRHNIPTVYFVAVNNVNHQKPFVHDVEAKCPLPVNTVAELREMADNGIEIGLHTFNHVDFSKVTSRKEVRYEIVDAKDKLEQLIGRRVRYFATPYGLPKQLTQVTFDAMREANLSGFCSAFGAYNIPGRDSFHIRRFHGDKNFWRFRKWLSFDPKKVLNEPVIDISSSKTSQQSFGIPNSVAASLPNPLVDNQNA